MRRKFLTDAFLTCAIGVLALTGCESSLESKGLQNKPSSGTSSAVEVDQQAGQVPSEFKQSPFFEGKGLPSVKDRLPKEPKLTNELPKDYLHYEIGTYGGNASHGSYGCGERLRSVYCQ